MENKNFYRVAYRYDFKEIKDNDYYKDIFYKNQILACLSITLKFKLISEKDNQEILFDFIFFNIRILFLSQHSNFTT